MLLTELFDIPAGYCIFLLVEILNTKIAHVEIIRVFHLSGNLNLTLTIHLFNLVNSHLSQSPLVPHLPFYFPKNRPHN